MLTRIRFLPTLLLVVCLAVLAPAAASAAKERKGAASAGSQKTFRVPGCLGSGGNSLAPATGRGVLFRACKKKDERFGTTLAHLLPNGKIQRRHVPKSEAGPMLAGTAGEIWLAAIRQKGAAAKGAALSLDRIAADGSVKTYPLGSPEAPIVSRVANGLVNDGAGGVWLAIGDLKQNYYGEPGDSGGGELVHIAADGTVSQFPLPEEIEPVWLARGPDGNFWFTGVKDRSTGERSTNPGTGYVGRITPAGELALYPTPTAASGPAGIAASPEGDLWFVEGALGGGGEVGTIATDGTFGPTFDPRGFLGGTIVFGRGGDAWLPHIEKGLVRRTPAGVESVYPNVKGTVVAGREGDIWALDWTTLRRVAPR